MMPYKHTKFQVETHQGAGPVGKKVGLVIGRVA